jgi:hypothetical protein
MYKDKLTQRIIDDVNSIKADLKQLGLNILAKIAMFTFIVLN